MSFSTNPFDEPDSTGEILEGLICPICREDLKSIEFLIEHFERSHCEEQDALKSTFKDIFSKAKKKILINFDEATSNLTLNRDRNPNIADSGAGNALENTAAGRTFHDLSTPQTVGAERSHVEYFMSVRNPRLERYAGETNKLIIRLHRLLKDMPTDAVLRKQHEQNTVAWLDGSSVKLCPNCAKSFHIARRQHHCRLCGSIMCSDCSKFLPLDSAMKLATISARGHETTKPENAENANPQASSIRVCEHCLWLLENRLDILESRTCSHLFTEIYADIQKLQKNIVPDLEMYLKIVNSLYDGESVFTISDASALRGKIGQVAESIDSYSKRIFNIPCAAGSREESIKKSIRLSCIQLIKERMLSLPPLPSEEQIREIQKRKRMEIEQRIETEQRMAMEAFQRYGLAESQRSNRLPTHTNGSVHSSDLHSLNNWSARQVNNTNGPQIDDPLVEQINIIKGYIKQARQEMNFDVIEPLELNLRELQREFYDRQKTAAAANKDSLGAVE